MPWREPPNWPAAIAPPPIPGRMLRVRLFVTSVWFLANWAFVRSVPYFSESLQGGIVAPVQHALEGARQIDVVLRGRVDLVADCVRRDGRPALAGLRRGAGLHQASGRIVDGVQVLPAVGVQVVCIRRRVVLRRVRARRGQQALVLRQDSVVVLAEHDVSDARIQLALRANLRGFLVLLRGCIRSGCADSGACDCPWHIKPPCVCGCRRSAKCDPSASCSPPSAGGRCGTSRLRPGAGR
jgi:hypothetical protein